MNKNGQVIIDYVIAILLIVIIAMISASSIKHLKTTHMERDTVLEQNIIPSIPSVPSIPSTPSVNSSGEMLEYIAEIKHLFNKDSTSFYKLIIGSNEFLYANNGYIAITKIK